MKKIVFILFFLFVETVNAEGMRIVLSDSVSEKLADTMNNSFLSNDLPMQMAELFSNSVNALAVHNIAYLAISVGALIGIAGFLLGAFYFISLKPFEKRQNDLERRLQNQSEEIDLKITNLDERFKNEIDSVKKQILSDNKEILEKQKKEFQIQFDSLRMNALRHEIDLNEARGKFDSALRAEIDLLKMDIDWNERYNFGSNHAFRLEQIKRHLNHILEMKTRKEYVWYGMDEHEKLTKTLSNIAGFDSLKELILGLSLEIAKA